MNRQSWASNWIKPAIDWFKHHAHRVDFFPQSRAVIDDYADAGVRAIIRVGGIDKNNQVPNGTILLWTGQNLPDGYQWVHPQNT